MQKSPLIQNLQAFIMKTLRKLGQEASYLTITKATHDKPTANITPNGEKLTAFPLKSGIGQ
jgi:hypothetical protein